jgi:Ca2+-binding RTX toxin-like protein
VGISLSAGGNTIANLGHGSSIFGGSNGISIAGGNNTIINQGSIQADHFAAIHLMGGKNSYKFNTINNTGVISVKNGHAILSDGYAHDTVVNMATHVDSGSINGDISLGGGADQLMNYGFIRGAVRLGAENDKVINSGVLQGPVYLDEGHDFFDGSKGSHKDIDGTKKSSGKIFCGEGNDTVFGSAEADYIVGGAGRDILIGNAGADSFYFDVLPDEAGVDQLRDFSAEDVMLLNHEVFGLKKGGFTADQFIIGTEAKDKNDHIIYDHKHGTVAFDRDGVGGEEAIVFAWVQPWLHTTHNKLTADNFLCV